MIPIIEFLERGRMITVPHVCRIWMPDIVCHGFTLAAFLFASAYLASRLQRR